MQRKRIAKEKVACGKNTKKIAGEIILVTKTAKVIAKNSKKTSFLKKCLTKNFQELQDKKLQEIFAKKPRRQKKNTIERINLQNMT